jgi:hypothetical protein
MKKGRQNLIEDKYALQDAIKRALTINDEEEVKRLTSHLKWLENYLGELKWYRKLYYWCVYRFL